MIRRACSVPRTACSRWPVALAVQALTALAQTASAQGTPTPNAERGTLSAVRFGVTVSRDTVSIGEPFEVRVRVRAPAQATIQFPEAPDTAGAVEARDPRTVVTLDSVQSRDQMAAYGVAAWDVGAQRILLDEVIVTWLELGARRQQRVPLGVHRVFVRSVLPADTALRVPKPARPLWVTRPFPWWLVALAAVALGWAVWWWRRRRRRGQVVAPAIVVDPFERAKREFDRVEALGLVDAGERTRYVALIVEILRDYLFARHPDAALALTSRELVAALRRRPAIPVDALAKVLHEADLAKFAGFALTESRARAVAHDARAIVEREHRASLALQVPATEAA